MDLLIAELGNYQRLVVLKLESGDIKENDRVELLEFKQNLLEDLKNAAFEDDRYNEEEWELIETVKEFLTVRD